MSVSPAADLPRTGGVVAGRVLPLRYYFESVPIFMGLGQNLRIKHGLGRKPAIMWWHLRCAVADGSWVPGDEITWDFFEGAGSAVSRAILLGAHETEIEIQIGSSNSPYLLPARFTGNRQGLFIDRWQLIVKAMA